MVNGYKVPKMALEFGQIHKAQLIWVNGRRIKYGAMAYINGSMEINMKEVGLVLLKMDKAQIILLIRMYTQVNIKKESLMATDSINGNQVQYMLVNLSKA